MVVFIWVYVSCFPYRFKRRTTETYLEIFEFFHPLLWMAIAEVCSETIRQGGLRRFTLTLPTWWGEGEKEI